MSGYEPQTPVALRGRPLETARSFRGLIEREALDAEQRGFVSDEVMQQLADAGLFSLLVPREFGGAEADPTEIMDVIDELAHADGATSWTFAAPMVGCGQAAGWAADPAANDIFGAGRGYLCAGHSAPLGRAVRADGGWRVSGKFRFGSGIRHATWVLGGFVETADGQPVLDAQGAPRVMSIVTPKANTRLLGNWDVMGLVATASYDFEVLEQFVSDDFVLAGRDQPPLRGGNIYWLGRAGLTGMAHGAWPLGVARRALDEVRDLSHRKQRFGRTLLVTQRTFQRDFALMEAKLRSAKAYLYETYERMYGAGRPDQRPPLDLRADARLAVSNAVAVAQEVVSFAYLAAGSDSLRNDSILQRCFRDLHAATQHFFTDEQTFVNSGRIFLAEPGAAEALDHLV
jgi:indole-3-acetate monooxygenase